MTSEYPSFAVELAKATLAILALLGAYVLLVLGPMGWIVLAALLVAAYPLLAKHREGGGDAPERANCPACGSPNAADNAVCEHCGEPL